MKEALLTVDGLRAILGYEPETGVFVWKQTGNRALAPGDVAGIIHPRGYVHIKIGRHNYAAHRLAWLYVYGCWPAAKLDHRNGIRSDNRIGNLRPCIGPSENNQNTAKYASNRSGVHGVGWHAASNRWRARISSGGKQHNLGVFETVQAAEHAYREAKTRLHAFQPMLRNA